MKKPTSVMTGIEWSTYRGSERHTNPLLEKKNSVYRVDLSGTIPPPVWVSTEAEADREVDRLTSGDGWVAIDTEYDETGLLSFQYSEGDNRVGVPRSFLERFVPFFSGSRPKIFHHAYADLPRFRQLGIKVKNFSADTLVMDWLVDENRRRHGLKYCGKEWLGISMTDYGDAFFVLVPNARGTASKRVLPPLRDVITNQFDRFVEYATLDPYVTYWLYQHHRTILERLPCGPGTMWSYYQKHEVPFTLTLTKMVARGLAIDPSVLKQIGRELAKTMARSRRIFVQYAQPIHVERTKQGEKFVEVIPPENINLRSPQQLSSLFYDMLGYRSVVKDKHGEPDINVRSTDEEHLRSWAEAGSLLAEYLLAYRRAATQLGTFIGEEGGKGLLSHIQRFGDEWLVQTDLIQTGTVSGRLASRNPNLQNIPSKKEKDPYRMRRAFVARKGCKLVVADYSQFELRIMAHLSRDKRMMQAFREDRDLHSITALKVFNLPCSESEVKTTYPDQRYAAKAINFGLQYGMRAKLLASQIGCDVDEGQRYIDAYFDLYQGVYRWMRRIVEQCQATGYVTTVLGRHRRVTDILIYGNENFGKRKHAENQAMNSPIQGSVADIIKIAMNQVERDRWLRKHKARLLLQVHDELIVEAPEEYAEETCKRVKEIMESAYELLVPTIVDAHVGASWEEAKG